MSLPGVAPATAFFLSLLILTGTLFTGACRWFAPKHLSEAERKQIAIRMAEAVKRAGGFRVWIKQGCGQAFPPAWADATIEVLALPGAFETVLSRVKELAVNEGLKIGTRESPPRERWRSVDIRLWRGEALAGHWRLREVPQLRRAAIVIDDLGQDLDAAQRLLELPCPLTFSVLPHRRHSAATAEAAHRAGREVMLHLPMEPEPGSPYPPGNGEIKLGMRSYEVARIIQQDLDSVPHARGVNNHMGSLATADPALMAEVMRVLAERHLYFVDSRTTGASVALDVARRRGVPAFFRSVFLDDVETTGYTLGQLRAFRRLVEEQGVALAIGHPHPSTVAALARFLPELERADIRLVPASELVQLPEAARLSPVRH